MSTQNLQNFNNFFLEFRNVPKDWEAAQNFFNWYLTQMTNFLNSKVGGSYTTSQVPCGKQLYISSKAYDAQRVTLAIGAMSAAPGNSYPHGIDTSKGFRLLNLYLAANDTATPKYFCVQYFSVAAGDILIDMDATNVNIQVASNYTAYNDCYIIIEFVQGVP